MVQSMIHVVGSQHPLPCANQHPHRILFGDAAPPERPHGDPPEPETSFARDLAVYGMYQILRGLRIDPAELNRRKQARQIVARAFGGDGEDMEAQKAAIDDVMMLINRYISPKPLIQLLAPMMAHLDENWNRWPVREHLVKAIVEDLEHPIPKVLILAHYLESLMGHPNNEHRLMDLAQEMSLEMFTPYVKDPEHQEDFKFWLVEQLHGKSRHDEIKTRASRYLYELERKGMYCRKLRPQHRHTHQ